MKRTSRIKRIACIGLVFLMSINSFAAIVSDNDGSVFVTKTEFEALKSSFNKQIDDYNNSIDKKIDGAVASYLAGIKINSPPSNLYDKIKNAIGGDLIFKNSVKSTTSTNTPEVNIYISSRYYIKTNQLPDTDYETWSNYFSATYNKEYINLAVCRMVPNLEHLNGGDQRYNFIETEDAKSANFDSRSNTGMISTDWVTWSAGTYDAYMNYIWNNATYNPPQNLKGEYTTTEEMTGSGTVYTYVTTADGKKF